MSRLLSLPGGTQVRVDVPSGQWQTESLEGAGR